MANLTFWGLVVSPFQLKMQSVADFAGVARERWWDQAGQPLGDLGGHQPDRGNDGARAARPRTAPPPQAGRAVVKACQVAVWRALCTEWRSLPESTHRQ